MNSISSSPSSRTTIEAPLSSASSSSTEKKDPPKTSGITEVHHLDNIQASIRSRPESVPGFAKLIRRDRSTTTLIENLSPTESELHAIFDRFAQKLTTIEHERSSKIQAAENTANAAQAHGMRRGMLTVISSDIEATKKRNISDIEKTATHQRNILFLQAKQELLEYQQSYFKSLLETYSTQSPSSARPAPTSERREECQQMIYQSFEAEQKIFEALGDLEQADEATIATALQAVALADTLRMRALHPFVEHSINTSLEQVEETSKLLETLSHSKNKFLNRQALTTFHEELDQRRANYLSAEPLFNEEVKKVALNNASFLQAKIEELNSELTRTSSEKTKTIAGDQPLLDQKISLLTTLSAALQGAQKAYERIADDASLKIKIPTALPNNFSELFLTSDQTGSTALKEAHESLSKLAAQTIIPSRTAGLTRIFHGSHSEAMEKADETRRRQDVDQGCMSPYRSDQNSTTTQYSSALAKLQTERHEIFGLNLLSKLSDFSEEENHHAIFGRRGEMELVDESARSFVTNAKLAEEGINLVRLAIFRDFGARGLQRFDTHFHDKRVALESPEAQNFLTIGELKEFIQTEDQINPSAFYLSSTHSIAELIFAESDPGEESKLIKADGTSFNPFSKTTPSKTALSADQETAEGRTATRAALKEFFKELPPELRQSILNSFDDKFKTIKTPLTVGELRAFLKKEIENLQTFHLNITGPFLYSLTWHLCTAALWATMMSAHPPAWVIMGISLGMGVGHDLTSYWRQLRPEDEK